MKHRIMAARRKIAAYLLVICGVLLLGYGLTPGPANAVVAHGRPAGYVPPGAVLVTDSSCPAGYVGIFVKASNEYLSADGSDAPTELSPDPANCWTTPGFGDEGYIRNRDGLCANLNASVDTIYAGTCANHPWVLWFVDQGQYTESNIYCNAYAFNTGNSNCWLNTESQIIGAEQDISGPTATGDNQWYTAAGG